MRDQLYKSRSFGRLLVAGAFRCVLTLYQEGKTSAIIMEKQLLDSKSSQIMFIYIALFTIKIVSQQLYRDNRKMMQQSLFPEENSVTVSDVSFLL